MPRPRLSLVERRHLKSQRQARWRQQVRARNSHGQPGQAEETRADHPFIYTSSAPTQSRGAIQESANDDLEGWHNNIELDRGDEPLRRGSTVREGVGNEAREDEPLREESVVVEERIDLNQGNKGSLEDQDQEQDQDWGQDEDVYISDKGARSRQMDSEQESDLSEIEGEEEQEQEPDHDRQVTDLPGSIEDQEEGGLLRIDSEQESISSDTIDEGGIRSPRTAWPQRESDSQGVVDEVDEVDKVDLAEELTRQLLQFNGCSIAAHQGANRQHSDNLQVPDQPRHLSLDDYSNQLRDLNVPLVINQPGFLTRPEREEHAQPDWPRIFEGCESEPERDQDWSESEQEADEGQGPDHICLACSQVEARTIEVMFDIDSFLGYTRSLAFAKQGFDINLFPRFHANIQNNLHLYTTVYYDYGRGEKPVKVKLQKVPHYCLGRVLGHEDILVYIFFPKMYHPDKVTNFPGSGGGRKHDLLRTWTNSVLIPAIFRHVPATGRQRIPCSWEQARGKAEAYYKERYTRGDPREAPSQARSLHYSLHPDSLAAIWGDVERRLLEPRNQIYQGAQLFFSSKNTKLRFAYKTVSGAWEGFNRTLESTIDLSYCDRNQVWFDLGKEVVGSDYALANEEVESDSVPTTHLFRTCCLETLSQWAALGEPGRSVIATIYPAAMLRDAGDLTLEMSLSSRKRAEGWVYTQGYNGYKECFDAAKTKPLSSPYLGQLAWDSLVAKMIQKQGRGYQVPNQRLQGNYRESKSRLFDALMRAAQLSNSTREEHRVSLAFFDRMRESLESTGDWDEPLELTAANSQHIWTLSSFDYTAYLGHNANKFMAAFEWIMTYSEKGRISYEHCKIMTMLLQALPFSFDSGPIMQKDGLWKSRFQRGENGPRMLGMGLQSSLSRCGYMWFLPRIDWGMMAFRERFAADMAFGNSMLRDFYRKNWGRVKDSKDDYARIEAAGKWLGLYRTNQDCKDIIYALLLLWVMRAYRKEIFAYLKPQCQPELYKEAAKGEVVLCYTELRRLLTPESLANMHIVNCQRTKIRSIHDLVSLLWGIDDGRDRGRWENSSFRVLCRRAVEVVRQHCGPADADSFHDMVMRYSIATHWLIPYPSPAKLFRKNSRKETVWIAVYHRRLAYSQSRSGADIPVDRLLNTVKPRPDRYRPLVFPWGVPFKLVGEMEAYREPEVSKEFESCIPARVRYMEDWDVLDKEDGPLMSQRPVESVEEYLRADASLEGIRRVLEEKWEVGVQIEGVE